MNQRLKALISGKAKKFSQLFIKNLFTKDMLTGYFTTMHDWLCHLANFLYSSSMLSDKANHAWLCEHVFGKKIFNKQLAKLLGLT